MRGFLVTAVEVRPSTRLASPFTEYSAAERTLANPATHCDFRGGTISCWRDDEGGLTMIEWLLIAEMATPEKIVGRFPTEQACVARLDDKPRGHQTFTCVNSEDQNDFVLPTWRYKNCKAKGVEMPCGRPRK
jgi:hypothetical protein